MKAVCIRVGVTLVAFWALFITASCHRAEKPKAHHSAEVDVVAVVAGKAIHASELQTELRRRFPNPRTVPTLEQKLAVLENLVRARALHAKAMAAGFDRKPEIEARVRSLIATEFKTAQFQPANGEVTESEIEAHYQANRSRYALPASVRAGVIQLELSPHATPAKQEEFKAYAERVLQEAKAAKTDAEFAEVVRRYSDDQATRYRGGDIGWVDRGYQGLDPALLEALFELKQPGEFTAILRVRRGVVFGRLVERQESGFRPIAEVKEAIRYQIGRRKQEQAEADFYASIKNGLSIVIDQRLVEKTSVPLEQSTPPRLPGTQTAHLQAQ